MKAEKVLRVNATKEHNRNSEGAFVELKDGTILFAYTRYIGEDWRDDACADIVVIKSKDGGTTWSEPEVVVEHDPGYGNVMSVSLLRLQSGRICFIYLKKRLFEGCTDCRPMLKFSDDDGATWSEPQYVIGAPGYYVVNNDRLIQLKSGRLLLPAACHRWKGQVSATSFGLDGRAVDYVYYSDDDGATWYEAPDWILPSVSESRTGLQEPGVVELEDGRVMLWARTDQGCQYKAFSYDGGLNWTDAIPAPEFLSPAAPLSMKRDPVTGDLVAIWNDQKPRYGMALDHAGRCPWSWDRAPYAMAFSSDNGNTWTGHNAFDTEEGCGFCYCAILFCSNGNLLTAYCSGGKPYGTETLQDITICRFTR